MDLESILLEDLRVELPDVAVRRLCVNQHLPETHWIRSHVHEDYPQCLLYLTGRGTQRVGGVGYPVNPGRLIYVRSGVPHAFLKEETRRPLCLVVDLEFPPGEESDYPVSSQLTASQLALVRRQLTALARLQKRSAEGNHAQGHGRAAREIREAGIILELTGVLLEAAESATSAVTETRQSLPPTLAKVRKILDTKNMEELTPIALAQQLGIQRDHLNRVLKRECGLTAGQLLAERRLEIAKDLLATSGTQVQDIGARIGLEDRSYFARWFRQQTGHTPSEWRRRNPSPE